MTAPLTGPAGPAPEDSVDDLEGEAAGIPPPRPVRSRLRLAILGATAGTLLLFALPLGLALRTIYTEEASTALQREASRIVALVPDEQLTKPNRIPQPDDRSETLGVYDATGRRVSGTGPVASRQAADVVATGVATTGREGAELATFLPVRADGQPTVVVRAALPWSTVTNRVLRAWALMGLLVLLVLGVAWWVAGRLARRLAAPLERLADSAATLGQGGFGLQVPPSGIYEVDVVGGVLEDSGRRLGDMFRRERAFSADASHQLRTPLTALRLTLESGAVDPAAEVSGVVDEALVQVDRLEQTVDDLLTLARDLPGDGQPAAVAAVVHQLVALHRPHCDAAGRRLEERVPPGLPEVDFPEPALRQVLEVLVDNACRHGAGTVRVAARTAGTGVAVDVCDQGRLPEGDLERLFARRSPQASGSGIGLALARSLAEADGARLVVQRRPDGTTFTVLMAAAPSADDSA